RRSNRPLFSRRSIREPRGSPARQPRDGADGAPDERRARRSRVLPANALRFRLVSRAMKRLVILALLSCKRDPPPAPVRATVPDAPTPSASVAAAEVDPNVPLRELAVQWNDAIDKADIAALGGMHGSDVRFYGVVVDNATYCAKMKAALAK